MSSSPPQPIEDKIQLYTYYRSSCSGRMRIALNLKGIAPTYRYINLLSNEQKSDEYARINPSHTVPTLVVTKPDGQSITIPQSISALEYLEDAYPNVRPLLPEDAASRATVRTLVDIIASDTQPITNLRILVKVSSLGGDRAAFAREMMTDGLLAYEAVATESAGRFSVGDEVTLADVCLVPAVWGAERFGVDFAAMPTARGVYERLMMLDEVKRAHWMRQEDTPVELRG